MKIALPEDDVSGGIYQIRNIITDKIYVGSAVTFWKRVRGHINELRRGRHHSYKLQGSWDKHGPDAFVFEVLEAVEDPAALIAAEQAWIDKLAAATAGYNVSPTAGSCLGKKHTEAAKAAMSRTKTGRPGRKLAQWEKENLSRVNRQRAAERDDYGRTQSWILEKPSGERVEIRNLNRFCQMNELHFSGMCAVADGRQRSHRGWRAWRINQPEPVFIPRPRLGDEGDDYILIDPSGIRHEGANLSEFARQQKGVTYHPLRAVARGKQYSASGWTAPAWGDKPPPTGGRHGEIFIFISPDGEEFESQNMSAFCREHNLTRANLDKVMKGVINQHKGWRVRRPGEIIQVSRTSFAKQPILNHP